MILRLNQIIKKSPPLHYKIGSLITAFKNSRHWISYFHCIRATIINVNNCPTRCDYMKFYYIYADGSTCFG